MWCNLYVAIFLVHSFWCSLHGASYVVRFTSCNICGAIYVVHSMWCNLRGAVYVVQSMWCKLRGAIYAVQPMWCSPRGAPYVAHSAWSSVCGAMYVGGDKAARDQTPELLSVRHVTDSFCKSDKFWVSRAPVDPLEPGGQKCDGFEPSPHGAVVDDARPWEWCVGNTKNTKWPTVGSEHSKCGLGMMFWEHE